MEHPMDHADTEHVVLTQTLELGGTRVLAFSTRNTRGIRYTARTDTETGVGPYKLNFWHSVQGTPGAGTKYTT